MALRTKSSTRLGARRGAKARNCGPAASSSLPLLALANRTAILRRDDLEIVDPAKGIEAAPSGTRRFRCIPRTRTACGRARCEGREATATRRWGAPERRSGDAGARRAAVAREEGRRVARAVV